MSNLIPAGTDSEAADLSRSDSHSNRLPILAEEIKRAHAGVNDAAKTAAERAIDAGRALLEAKALVKHGEWLPWLEQHCGIPERTCRLYMHLAKLNDQGLESATIADMGLNAAAKAVVLAYPYPNIFDDGPEETRREWWTFLLLMIRDGVLAEDAHQYCERLKRWGFDSPREWLTEEGDKFCESHHMRPTVSKKRAEWLSLLSEYHDRPLLDIEAACIEAAKGWEEKVAAGQAVLIEPGIPKRRRRRRAAS